MDALETAWKAGGARPFRFVAVGSGAAARLGIDGQADVVFVHDPGAAARLRASGRVLRERAVMKNRFVLAGPEDDPAGVAGTRSFAEAFARIAAAGARFASRADSSGTHEREREIWRAAGIDPTARPWYVETGRGMASALDYAYQRGAYILVDGATAAVHPRGKLLRLFEFEGSGARNLYEAFALTQAGGAFVDWLGSAPARAAIQDVRVDGRMLFEVEGP